MLFKLNKKIKRRKASGDKLAAEQILKSYIQRANELDPTGQPQQPKFIVQ